MTRLFEVAKAYSELEQLIENDDAEDQQLIVWMNECSGELKEKITNITALVQNLEVTSDAIKSAENRMKERRQKIDRRVESIKSYLLNGMKTAGINKIECDYFKISIRNNPPSVIIDDEAAIPMEYLRQPEPPAPQPDKKAILSDIQQGVIIEGCHIERGQSLVIK